MRKEELRTYIENHESEMIEDLKSLIRIPSEKQAAEPGKPFGAPAAEALAQGIEILEKYGFAVTNYDNYAIAADFNQEEKGLDILAHLDVVPAGEGWQETDPFIPLIKERKTSVLSSVPTRSVEALTSNIIIRKKWKHHAPSHRMPNSRSSTLKKAACAATSKKHPMPERQACASYPYRPAPN